MASHEFTAASIEANCHTILGAVLPGPLRAEVPGLVLECPLVLEGSPGGECNSASERKVDGSLISILLAYNHVTILLLLGGSNMQGPEYSPASWSWEQGLYTTPHTLPTFPLTSLFEFKRPSTGSRCSSLAQSNSLESWM